MLSPQVSTHNRNHTRSRQTRQKHAHSSPLAAFFKNEKTVSAVLADRAKCAEAVAQLAKFAEKDHNMAETEISYGEALYNILQLPIESQKALVWAIADRNDVKRPEYPDGPKGRGRQPSGRKQLAEAQYGMWPDMLKLEGKNKDTRAGMLITHHVRNFRIDSGLLESRKTRTEGGLPRRTLKITFEALMFVVKNDSELRLIGRLFERLGVESEDLEDWAEEVEPLAKVA